MGSSRPFGLQEAGGKLNGVRFAPLQSNTWFKDSAHQPNWEAITLLQLQVITLTCQFKSNERIARLLGTNTDRIFDLKQEAKRKLGIKNEADLRQAFWRTQYGYEQTPAQFQYEEVIPTLIGAKVLCGVLRDREFLGLMVELKDGKSCIAWLSKDEDGESAGWLDLQWEEDERRIQEVCHDHQA